MFAECWLAVGGRLLTILDEVYAEDYQQGKKNGSKLLSFQGIGSLIRHMPNQVNTPIAITHNGSSTNYLCSSKHRGNPTHDISVWLVDLDAEVTCFTVCYQSGWHNGTNGWSFLASGMQQLLRLGHNLRNQDLLIAKFVTDQNQWHGYPADIRHKPADKPLPTILSAWLAAGHISKALMSRIKQGQL